MLRATTDAPDYLHQDKLPYSNGHWVNAHFKKEIFCNFRVILASLEELQIYFHAGLCRETPDKFIVNVYFGPQLDRTGTYFVRASGDIADRVFKLWEPLHYSTELSWPQVRNSTPGAFERKQLQNYGVYQSNLAHSVTRHTRYSCLDGQPGRSRFNVDDIVPNASRWGGVAGSLSETGACSDRGGRKSPYRGEPDTWPSYVGDRSRDASGASGSNEDAGAEAPRGSGGHG